ncbi:hypothetical protein V1511DRAFT_491734 [Dipodascopsis uninucleata]
MEFEPDVAVVHARPDNPQWMQHLLAAIYVGVKPIVCIDPVLGKEKVDKLQISLPYLVRSRFHSTSLVFTRPGSMIAEAHSNLSAMRTAIRDLSKVFILVPSEFRMVPLMVQEAVDVIAHLRECSLAHRPDTREKHYAKRLLIATEPARQDPGIALPLTASSIDRGPITIYHYGKCVDAILLAHLNGTHTLVEINNYGVPLLCSVGDKIAVHGSTFHCGRIEEITMKAEAPQYHGEENDMTLDD